MFDDFPLPPEDRDIVEQVRALAREKFAPRAAAHDDKAAFPAANFDDLKKAGLTALRVPRELGGKEISSLAYLHVLRALANACGSTALTFNMHSTVAFFATHLGTAQARRYWGKRLSEGMILGSLGSEPFNNPFLPGAIASLDSVLVKRGNGYHLKTRKAWCSLGSYADAWVVYVLPEGAKNLETSLSLAVVEKAPTGITFIDDWDAVGMRGTSSITIDFDVDLSADHVIGEPGELIRANLRAEYSLGYCGTYYGIAEAAYAFAASSAKTALGMALAPGRDRMNPDIGRLITECGYVRAQLATMWIAAQHAATSTTPGTEQRRRSLITCKAVIAERAAELVQRAVRVAGAKSIYRKHPIERQYRDVLAGLVMAARPEHGYYMVGFDDLGVAAILESGK